MKYVLIVILVAVTGVTGYLVGLSTSSVSEEVSHERTTVVTVAPERQPCTGVAPQECLVVDGELFYDTIAGFTYEPGFTYVLEISQTKRDNVPADASALQYELVTVVSKTPAEASAVNSEAANELLGTWQWVETERGLTEEITPTDATAFTLTFANGNVSVTTDCNNGSGTYEQDGQQLTFGPLAVTEMACLGDTQEEVFFTILSEVIEYDIYTATSSRLVLMSAEEDSVFVQVAD